MEENTQQVTETVEIQPVQTQTLEDVYKQFGVEEEVAKFRQEQAKPAVETPKPQSEDMPSPYDEPAFKSYMERQRQGTTELQQSLKTIADQLTQYQYDKAKQSLDADIKSAVDTFKSESGIDDPDLAEALLDAKARKDSRFKIIWENRHQNSRALEAALKGYGNEIRGKFDVKVDPKLQEAQRARKLSQQSKATTESDTTDEWDGLDDAQFEQKVRMAIGNY